MYGLNSHIVKERILRRHYGIATSIVWDGAKHPVERRWKDHLDGTWRVDVMKWYVVKVLHCSDILITGTTSGRCKESRSYTILQL